MARAMGRGQRGLHTQDGFQDQGASTGFLSPLPLSVRTWATSASR